MNNPTWKVLRWPVPVDDQEHHVGGGQVCSVMSRENGIVELWTYELTSDQPVQTTRLVRVFGTGQPLPPGHLGHLGSTLDGERPELVWHLFAMAGDVQ